MKKTLLYSLLFLLFSHANAQKIYTQNKYSIQITKNINYGVATDYAGNPDSLLMDLYKPIGDSNCLRPVMVMVHGGAWIGGSKEDNNITYMAAEMAKKGWVVATINYRLGTHKASNYTMYALCNSSLSAPCGYISDSAEIYRANFRAMQDAKGVIRYMKIRNITDSSDVNNVFICGESAGGFVALAAAFTDQASEKDSSCYAIANAPTPDQDLNTYGCIPNPLNLSRPDLGSIDGTLYLNAGFDAKVKGVGNFYGGILNLSIIPQATDTPLVYMFHQGSDVVVHYKFGRLLGRTSFECYSSTNICQPYYFYPNAHGSESIRLHFASLSNPPTYIAEIISNYSYQNNCFSNGHSIDNVNLRMGNMLDLFSDKISASGNNPATNCQKNSIQNNNFSFTKIYPNPANTFLYVNIEAAILGLEYTIYDQTGRIVLNGHFNENYHAIDLSQLVNGIYFIQIGSDFIESIAIQRG